MTERYSKPGNTAAVSKPEGPLRADIQIGQLAGVGPECVYSLQASNSSLAILLERAEVEIEVEAGVEAGVEIEVDAKVEAMVEAVVDEAGIEVEVEGDGDCIGMLEGCGLAGDSDGLTGMDCGLAGVVELV